MDQEDIRRFIRRMSIQIWEKLDEENKPVIIGLNSKGYAMGKEIARHLTELLSHDVPVHEFMVRDTPSNNTLPDCSDRHVILVDDVIFSGRTMFEAISIICKTYEPALIQTLVLIDRGHRKYPIKADLVGRSTPTKVGEHIEVMLSDDRPGKVILFKNT
ncbi:phosphoribosyltransferase family protein [Gracilimonas aurantiaca]|uniref:phosphoribosyltransferase family protein n=1 Tax=Gracilimonas aurantiaca TaxID=3234185 RepID=UPI003466942F